MLSLTIPQVVTLQKNLQEILKAESGKEDEKEKEELNTEGYGSVLKMLQEKTGRTEFTLPELMNPNQTLERYNKSKQSKKKV